MRAGEQQIRRFERLSGRVLLGGVWTSAAILALGLALWATSAGPIVTRVLNIGIMVLMATPVARVVVSLVEYFHARDWFFVATAAAVLLVLLAAVGSAVWIR